MLVKNVIPRKMNLIFFFCRTVLLMHYPIRIDLFSSRQAMDFRGHNESEDSIKGNFKGLLNSYIEGSSLKSMNEAEHVRRRILSKLKTLIL